MARQCPAGHAGFSLTSNKDERGQTALVSFVNECWCLEVHVMLPGICSASAALIKHAAGHRLQGRAGPSRGCAVTDACSSGLSGCCCLLCFAAFSVGHVLT